MTDVNPAVNRAAPVADAEEILNRGMELLFYAYRDFTADPEGRLAAVGFGRAHYRILYFVGRNPGISVAELLGILRITKQSLSRVLTELLDRGHIEQRRDARDQRRRLLYLTEQGEALERHLSEFQRSRVAVAFEAAGPDAAAGFREVMLRLINEGDRARLEERAADDLLGCVDRVEEALAARVALLSQLQANLGAFRQGLLRPPR